MEVETALAPVVRCGGGRTGAGARQLPRGVTQVFVRIDGGIVNADLVVQVRAGAVPGGADVAKDVSAADILSCRDRKPGKMGIKGLNAVAMVDNHFASVSVAHSGL